MEERHVKGVHLVNVFKFVKWKRGILGVKRFLEEWHGQAGHQKITEQAFIEKEWYDYELYLELLKVADKSVGKGDLSKIYEVGYWNIKNLGHLSYVAMAPDIHEFMSSAMKNWHSVYDFGSVKAIVDEEKKLVIRYLGFPKAPEKCQYFLGSLTGMMEICRLKGTVEQTACNTKGDDYCEFALTWE